MSDNLNEIVENGVNKAHESARESFVKFNLLYKSYTGEVLSEKQQKLFMSGFFAGYSKGIDECADKFNGAIKGIIK